MLFLVACTWDEGLYEHYFKVVEAESRLAIAQAMLRQPDDWEDWLRFSRLWEAVSDGRWTAAELLERIDATYVDGDSDAKLSIYEITEIERISTTEED